MKNESPSKLTKSIQGYHPGSVVMTALSFLSVNDNA
jgi:hypothetical protein